MTLDLTSLQLAISSLKRSLKYAASPLAEQDPNLFEQFRNSSIQCFEFVYELSWKFLKRQLEQNAPTPSVIDTLSYNELIRLGAEQGLINNPEDWFKYRYYRNLTSHAYDQVKAEEIYQHLNQFLLDASALLATLKIK
jgi:nucleotidyltransferase substrate binding protein (TIGR01987 family)